MGCFKVCLSDKAQNDGVLLIKHKTMECLKVCLPDKEQNDGALQGLPPRQSTKRWIIVIQ